MNFSGKYQLQSQENFEPFMKAIGVPDDLIQKGKDAKGVSEIVQNGKHFKITTTTGSKVSKNEFTLGQECEIETMTGEKVKAVVNMEGNKLVTTFKNVKSVTELNGDTLTSGLTMQPTFIVILLLSASLVLGLQARATTPGLQSPAQRTGRRGRRGKWKQGSNPGPYAYLSKRLVR